MSVRTSYRALAKAGAARRAAAALAMAALMTGCLEQPSRMKTGAPLTGGVGTEAVMAGVANGSSLIRNLQSRNSVLPEGGPFDTLAAQVLAASKGAAAAELRVAQLKADARAKNWLPQIGPSVSLTTLSGLVAGLSLTQPLLDNGRRKAERDFAAADVEVAAVGLSMEMNQRVFEGLTHYINAQRAHAQAAVTRRASDRLAKFENLMQARVDGGLSDMSQQQVITQRYAEVQAQLAGDAQAAASAEAQLAALTGTAPHKVKGIDTLRDMRDGPAALSVLRTQGEGARVLAQAQLSKSEMMPGISTSADATEAGTNTGLRLTGLGILNPGSSATMQALAETQTVVQRQNAEAAEAAQRRLIALSGEIATLNSRAAQGAKVLAQSETNLELFSEQYKLGRSSLLELVSQYDAFAQLERDQESLRFDIALRTIEIARDLGLLVDGEQL